MSYSHRKDYVDWIEEARRPETRERKLRRRSSKSEGESPRETQRFPGWYRGSIHYRFQCVPALYLRSAREAGKSVLLARDVLMNGRDLVAQGWSQGADARDAAQKPVHPWSSEARSWSVLGAIICGDETRKGRVPIDQLARAAVVLAGTLDTPSLSKWNDQPGRTQAEAVAAFDAALASAAERPESQVQDSTG